MKTTFHLTGYDGNVREITKKEAIELFGPDRFKEALDGAKQTFMEEPDTFVQFMVRGGRVEIRFS